MKFQHQAAASAASTRKIAIAAGVLYLITHVTSVAARFLYAPILNDAGFITGRGAGTPVLIGVVLDVILAMAVAGTAVALFPVARRQNEGLALGYVGLRTLEAGIIAAGVVPLLAVVALRQNLAGAAGADPVALAVTGRALVELYRGTFVVGPGLVCGVNTVVMAYLLYRSRLVPRFIPVLGLAGGPLVFAYNAGLVFGLSEQVQSLAGILVIPIFAWELSLAIRLITRGFNPVARRSAPAGGPADAEPNELASAA